MAGFCGNCGAKLDEGQRVCGQCGTPVEGAMKTPVIRVDNPEKKKKSKRRFKAVTAIIVVVLIGVIAVNVVLKFTGYNGLLRKVMKAYEAYDIEKLVSLSSNIYYYGEENYGEDYFESKVGESLEFFETSVGHNYKISYEINETYKMSNHSIKETLDQIEYKYSNFDISTIEEIVVCDLNVTAKQDSKSQNKGLSIFMSKEKGEWKLLYIQ